MSDLENWIARGVVSAIVAACVGLFVRVRRLESASAVITRAWATSRSERVPPAWLLGARMRSGRARLVKLSTALESLPDAREFAALGRSVTAVQGEIAALRATLDGVDRMMAGLDKQLDQINAHLLGGGA